MCSPSLREAQLERILFLHAWITFPEKWNKIASFHFEEYEFEWGGYFAFLSKLGYVFTLRLQILKNKVVDDFLLNLVILSEKHGWLARRYKYTYILLHKTQEFYSIKLICTNLYALFSHVRKAYTANQNCVQLSQMWKYNQSTIALRRFHANHSCKSRANRTQLLLN